MCKKSSVVVLIICALLLIECYSEKPKVSNKYNIYESVENICMYYIIGGEELVYLSQYLGGRGKKCVLTDTNLAASFGFISPFQHTYKEDVLVVNRDQKLFSYNLKTNNFTSINVNPRLDIGYYYYFNKKLLLIDTLNSLYLYNYKEEQFIKEFELQVNDKDIFNIYGGINSKNILIESGYFPSGGCEYIKYHSLNLNDYSYKDITDKILPINKPESPFDIYYMDVNQEYFFFPNNKRVRDFEWEAQDDYVLNSNFDTIGRALKKRMNYNNSGYRINNMDEIEFYFFEIEDQKMVCFPININFEKQMYNTYYEKKLIKEDIAKLEGIEIELLQSTIILKNNGTIKKEKIKDILSLYAFSYEYEEHLSAKYIVSKLEGNDKYNYELLQSVN